MLTLFVVQNLWWVFLLTTITLLFKCISTQKKLSDFRNVVELRRIVSKKRLRMAQDLGDELSNGFNNIGIIAKENNSLSSEESVQNFRLIQQMCDDKIHHMEDVIWAVKNKECSVQDLIFKLEDCVDDMLRDKGIAVEIKKRGLPMERKLGFAFRRNYLLFFTEALSFFLENTHPSKVKISFQYDLNHFELWLENEYSEKVKSSVSMGERIVRMRQLVEGIGGKTIIKDEVNRYTIGLIMKRK